MFSIQFLIKHSLAFIIATVILFSVTNSDAQPLLIGNGTCGVGLVIDGSENGKNRFKGGGNSEVAWSGTQWQYKSNGVVFATNNANTSPKAPCSANYAWTLTEAGKNACGTKPLVVTTNCSSESVEPEALICKNSGHGARLDFVSTNGDLVNVHILWPEGSTFHASNNLSISNGVCQSCPRVGGIGFPHGREKDFIIKRTDLNKPVVIKWVGTFCGEDQSMVIP